MFDFDALSRAMVGQTVLCIGDLMLDEFVYGEVSRISPEAPAPVIAVQRSELNVGGAGGTGEKAGDVSVTNEGLIWTKGEDAAGISANSIGGGGGIGGAVIDFRAQGKSANNSINVNVGGAGGTGEKAGDVSVTNEGLIWTKGEDAAGISANSIGGGGGIGGAVIDFRAQGKSANNSINVNVGGAGNAARNIASLGARCLFVGLVGEDDAGKTLRAELGREPLIEPLLVVDPARPTTRKVRYVSEHFSTHMLRADWEQASPASDAIERKLIDTALAALPRADIVLLSDYAKGVLTARVIRNVIDAARKLNKRVIVDPKSANFAIYRGASLLTPNRKELVAASRSRAGTAAEIATAARELMLLADCPAMLVKQSEHGMTLVPGEGAPIHVPAQPVKVRDVSGAGDTVAAVLAVTLAAGAEWEAALRCANAGAAVSVGKQGTATVSLAELRRRLLPPASLAAEEKIAVSAADLDSHLADWRKQDLRVGFTNGCFDILHPGHVRVLTQARATCDRLIVGLNSDASVKRLKGEGRPVQNERARAEVLAALEAVDLVAIFEDDTPLDLITRIRPSVLVKGGDYTREQVVGHEIVEAHGGEVVLVDILEGFSTTSLVKRAREGKDNA